MRRSRIAIAVVIGVGVTILAFLTLRPDSSASTALTWTQLRNTTYPLELPRSKVAPLQDGVYEEAVAPGSASKLKIQLADIAGFGPIDDGRSTDAAVILIGSPGGSGTFIYLAAVLNQDGQANPVASTLLGDRVAVRGIRIEAGKIIVSMRVRGANDPLTTLTREVTRTYSLKEGKLVVEGEQAVDVTSTPPDQFAFQPETLSIAVGKGVDRQGTLQPGDLATYLVHGDIGQQLNVSVSSQFNNAVLSIHGISDGTQLVSRTSYATSWSGILPSKQDYAVSVVTLAGNDLKYDLTVELRQAPTPAPTSTTKPGPTATRPAGNRSAPVVPTPLAGAFHPAQKPLNAVSSDAAQFLNSRAPAWSAAVVMPSATTVYSQNGDSQLELASAAKVLIALAVLDAAQREGRYVDRFELSLLWPMITLSDNDSATQLWDQIGGGPGLSNYLASIGATGITPYDGPFWGTSTASANSLATVVARAAFGDLLNGEHRKLLLALMEGVTPSERWGVSAAAEGEGGTGDLVGLKNGWYPDVDGWRVNSVGFVVSSDGLRYYTIAVLTNEQPSWDYGIATIEGVAERVHSAIRSGATGP